MTQYRQSSGNVVSRLNSKPFDNDGVFTPQPV